MSRRHYYLRSKDGDPVWEELLALKPFIVGESLAVNALLAIRDHFSKGKFPNLIKNDRYVSVVNRKVCNRTNIQVYEVFFDYQIFPSVTYLAIGCLHNQAVAYAIGTRDRDTAISRLSNYPYIDFNIERLTEEFGIPAEDFEWSTSTGHAP
jgi:hypothetical protein